jgi:DNA-binding CsgD family transcriptional regulator
VTTAELVLAPDAEQVYRAFLRSPGAPLSSLAHACASDEPTVERVLEELRERGLLRRAADGRLSPARPDLALEPSLLEAERELVERQRQLLQARREVSGLVEAYANAVADTGQVLEAERVDGFSAINKRIYELVTSSTSEVLNISLRGQRSPEAIAEGRTIDIPMLLRGVRMRSIVPPTVLESAETYAWVRELSHLGDEHRVLDSPPLQMLLLDRRLVVVPVDPQEPSDAALFLWSPTLVACFASLFELAWRTAEPLFRDAPADDEGLGDRERELLTLLASGVKDEAVARHLGCSVRTVRRDEQTLFERLGARTRFQAGAEAVRRGWL